MKRIFFMLPVLLMIIPAMANEDGIMSMCPVCECPRRSSYAGFRLYINEHSIYSYHLSNGHKETKSKDNFGFGTTAGSNLTDYLRIEYETLYMGAQYSQNNKDFEYDIWANMLNAYVYHEFDNAYAPYAGAGLGLTGIWGEIDNHLDNAFDLSYQVLAGILFKLNSRIDIDVGFKYINFGKVKHTHGVSKVDATQIYIGAIYKFGI